MNFIKKHWLLLLIGFVVAYFVYKAYKTQQLVAGVAAAAWEGVLDAFFTPLIWLGL